MLGAASTLYISCFFLLAIKSLLFQVIHFTFLVALLSLLLSYRRRTWSGSLV